MRRLLTLDCEGATLGATLDGAEGDVGLLLVIGGSQTRIGSHRMYERLAKALAEQGFPCLRFDRRGTGDSSDEDPGFRGSAPDITAAEAALLAHYPALSRLHALGLCDGASAIALFGDEAGLDGLVLVNPWLVEAASGEPPPAAIRRHYRDRLLSLRGWKDIVSGAISYRKLLRGISKIVRRSPSSLAQDVAAALQHHSVPAQVILCRGDATAIAADAEFKTAALRGLAAEPLRIDSDSHTFARPGDEEKLLAAVLEALRRL